MASVSSVNLLTLATSLPYAAQLASIASNATSTVDLLSYNETFTTDILDLSKAPKLLANLSWEAFHEAGVYNQHTNSIYIASNWDANVTTNNPVNVTILNLADDSVTSTRYPGLFEANGGTTYVPPNQLHNTSYVPQLLFCDEGDFTGPSGLVLVDPVANTTKPLISTFLGRNFTSVNDVRQHYATGDLWFTDAAYGFFQNFRPVPTIPQQVYRFEPLTGVVQVVADGFVEPNGFEFSPDFLTAYITDTGAQEFGVNYTRPATIYAYDVVDQKYLANRRVFAYSDSGFPDGIHADTQGNVWSSCGSGDGVHVWNKEGNLLGKLVVEGGSNNFAFIPGAILVFNAQKLYSVAIKVQGRELARDFGPKANQTGK